MQRTVAVGLATVAAAAAWTAARQVDAGSLTPPGGPISPTMLALDVVEPRIPLSAATTPGDNNSVFAITQPGSYYLTDNLTVPAGFRGIEVDASPTTIDLMGFTITGVPGSLEGISTAGTEEAVTIRNGVVRSTGGAGVSTATAARSILEDLQVYGANNAGILAGNNAIVRRCVVESNAGAGVAVGSSAVIDDVVAVANGTHGIVGALNVVVHHCVTRENGQRGVNLGANGVVSEHASRSDGHHGIGVGNNAAVTACAVQYAGTTGGSAYSGIATGLYGAVTESTVANGFGNGISVGAHSAVADSTASGNGLSGVYSAGAGVRVADVVANLNSVHGVELQNHAQVTGTTAYDNTGNGIHLTTDGRVANSLANANEYGIYATTRSQITGCRATLNSIGIYTFGAAAEVSDCSTAGNTASGINTTAAPGGYAVRNRSTADAGGGIVLFNIFGADVNAGPLVEVNEGVLPSGTDGAHPQANYVDVQ